MHLLYTGVNFIIDQQIIICLHAGSLLCRPAESGVNDLNGFRPPAHQTAAQLLSVRRRDKNKKGIRKSLLYLQRTLNLNLQNHVFSFFHSLLHIRSGRTVIVIYILGILYQPLFFYHLLKLFPCNEEIILPSYFPFSWLPCGSRHRQCVIIIPPKQLLHKRPLACPGKSRYNH